MCANLFENNFGLTDSWEEFQSLPFPPSRITDYRLNTMALAERLKGKLEDEWIRLTNLHT
jgi:hypothetical protein